MSISHPCITAYAAASHTKATLALLAGDISQKATAGSQATLTVMVQTTISGMSREDHLRARIRWLQQNQDWKKQIYRQSMKSNSRQTVFWIAYLNKEGVVCSVADNLFSLEIDYTDLLINELTKRMGQKS